jgi:hypothetical protein
MALRLRKEDQHQRQATQQPKFASQATNCDYWTIFDELHDLSREH